jgi:hypothetical protein
MKKDKEKVIDEVWTEDRIRSFLEVRSHDEVNSDFHMLHKAYQSMRADDFEIFIGFFLAAGHNLNTTNPQGETVLSIVDQHRRGDEYAVLLRSAGAS